MSYPRNAASPPPIAIGAIYLTADGTIQTTDALVRVKTGTGSWGTGSGTLACDTTSGVWVYTPTQAETNAESFLVAVYKAASTTAQITVVTSASATAGYGGLDWGKITAATSTVALTNTTVGLTTAAINAVSDQVWDEIIAQHLSAGSAGKIVDTIKKANILIEGTVLASPTPTTTVFNVSGINYPTGAFKHAILAFADDATLAEQNSPILTYVNNGNGTATITVEEPFTTAPTAGDKILIDPFSHVHAIAAIQAGLATSAALLTAQDSLSNIQGRLPEALIHGLMGSNTQAISDTVMNAIRAGLSTLTSSQVKAEIVDAITNDACAEPANVPAADSSLKDKISWLFMLAKNRLTQTSNTQTVFRDDASTPAATANVSDDGTTATRGKFQ